MDRHKIIISILFLFLFLNSFAQPRYNRDQYIDQYKDLAIKEMKEFGIPASITLAQGCLESENGNSSLARRGNNHFGIKCKGSWDGASVFFDDDEKNECFRCYKSPEDSYADHSNFLISNRRYSSLFSLPKTDYVGWANGLKSAGYATDPNYASRLIKIIEDFHLDLLDRYGSFKGDRSADIRPNRTESRIRDLSIRLHRAIRLHNGLQTITVEPNETFAQIAQSVDIKEWEILRYNDYSGGQPRSYEVLYIEPKRGRAESGNDYYIARDGDSMHFISQLYGIRMKSLLRKNRMDADQKPAPGQKIYLRTKISKSEAAQRIISRQNLQR